MFQDFALFPHMSVAANVAFGKGVGSDIEGLLERLDLAPLSKALPHELIRRAAATGGLGPCAWPQSLMSVA